MWSGTASDLDLGVTLYTANLQACQKGEMHRDGSAAQRL